MQGRPRLCFALLMFSERLLQPRLERKKKERERKKEKREQRKNTNVRRLVRVTVKKSSSISHTLRSVKRTFACKRASSIESLF